MDFDFISKSFMRLLGALLCAVAFLDFSLRHSIHHRGQLSTYLRAMGGKVPPIYGESHDSAAAKKAAGG